MEKDKRIEEKAKFYFKNKMRCHITLENRWFLNGVFLSDLINKTYYLFLDDRNKDTSRRLFICDIFDIKDYTERV